MCILSVNSCLCLLFCLVLSCSNPFFITFISYLSLISYHVSLDLCMSHVVCHLSAGCWTTRRSCWRTDGRCCRTCSWERTRPPRSRRGCATSCTCSWRTPTGTSPLYLCIYVSWLASHLCVSIYPSIYSSPLYTVLVYLLYPSIVSIYCISCIYLLYLSTISISCIYLLYLSIYIYCVM